MSTIDPYICAGKTVADRYRLGSTIGDGGYGVVYQGQDLRTGAAVAVKLSKCLDVSNRPAAEEAMRRESSVRLHHPCIASPIDGGEYGGHLFVTSQLAPGQTIQSSLMSGWVPSDMDSANILAQSLDAAQACHDAGIIHRDLSSRNVLIDRTTCKSTTVDFGSVYLLHDTSQRHEQHFHATPGIIPPEMLGGQSLDPGPGQDLFALGVLGYELLTGDAPFNGSTPAEVNRSVIDRTCLPIQHQAPQADPRLIGVIDRLMSHYPENRYASAREAIREIATICPLHETPASTATSSSSTCITARCSYCGHRSTRPTCKSCGKVFLTGMVITLWESLTAVHSVYFIVEEEHAFGRSQIDPQDRTISRHQILIAPASGSVFLIDGGSINPSTIQGASPDGRAQPGTTLFTLGRYTGHLISA